jgi:hypothetical protein
MRRVVAMVTASVAVLGLGFVVAVAAASLPGSSEEEPLFDVDFTVDLNLSSVVAWILVMLALAGAVLFALGLSGARPREETRRRNILGVLIGLIVFIAIFRWVRPAVEGLLEEGPAAADSAADATSDGDTGTSSGWLFSLLLAAVLAATLTRIGLSIKGAGSPFETDVVTDVAEQRSPDPGRPPVARSLGTDPRSRILNAYQEFESGLASAGQPRAEAETTGRHAHRAGGQLGLDADLVGDLVERHAAARYGSSEPAESDAESAEQSSRTIQERMIE